MADDEREMLAQEVMIFGEDGAMLGTVALVIRPGDDPTTAEIEARAREAWAKLELTQQDLDPADVAAVQRAFAEVGTFDRLAEHVSDVARRTLTLEDGDEEDAAALAEATRGLHELAAELVRHYTALADFRERFTRDVLTNATAWALDRLEAEIPPDQLAELEGDAFREAFSARYSDDGNLEDALRYTAAAHAGHIGDLIADTIEQRPGLGDQLAETAREELRRRLAQPPPEKPPSRRRSGRRLGLKPVAKSLPYPNEPGYRALTYAATSDPKAWQVDADRAVLPTPLLDPAKRRMAVTLDHGGVAAPDTLAFVAEMLRAGEDGTALKVLFALPALFFDHHPGADFNSVYETTIPDLMRYMGFKQKGRGGFDREDQERVWRAIRLLARLWVPGVTGHTRNGRRVVSGEDTWYSPVIVLQGLQEGPYGVQVPRAVRYSLGKEFHAYYSGDAGTRTRMLQLSPKIMGLHGHDDLNALRLAVYYASQTRIRKAGGGVVRVGYGKLLEQAGVPVDRNNPKRQFGRVIQWHEELRAKGIIGDFAHTTAPPRGSAFGAYRDLVFTVRPPALELADGAA